MKCSACQVEVSDWYDHIGSAHNYLAYKEGDPPVVSFLDNFLYVRKIFLFIDTEKKVVIGFKQIEFSCVCLL